MLPRRRENSDQEKQFSFSGPLATESSDDQFETWAERIKSDHHGHFGRASNVKVGAWAKIRSTNYVNPDEGEFQGLGGKEDHEDVPSPPLWGSRSPAEAYPMLGLTMRSQMMARYRKEMIDLVRDVPENAYELSLRDIVEVNPTRPVLKTSELDQVKGEEKKEKKQKGGRRKMSRSESLDTGLLLRMFVPTTMRRKKSFGAAGSVTCSKVSPKPVVADGGGEILEKGPDGEWWKKKDIDELKSSSSSGSSSGGSTTTSSDSSSSSNNNNKSNSSSSNTGRRKKSRCLPFLNFCKSKTRGA